MTTGAFSRMRRFMGLADSKLGKQKPKLGKSTKPKLGKAPPSLDNDDLLDTFTPDIALSKKELNSHSPLEVREQTFIDEYLIDLSSTQAGIHARHSPKATR